MNSVSMATFPTPLLLLSLCGSKEGPSEAWGPVLDPRSGVVVPWDPGKPTAYIEAVKYATDGWRLPLHPWLTRFALIAAYMAKMCSGGGMAEIRHSTWLTLYWGEICGLVRSVSWSLKSGDVMHAKAGISLNVNLDQYPPLPTLRERLAVLQLQTELGNGNAEALALLLALHDIPEVAVRVAAEVRWPIDIKLGDRP